MNILINLKIIDISIYFFKLSTEKSFETLPKHNGTTFISESFALNLYISTPLANI